MVDKIEVLQKIYGHIRGDIDLPSFREWMVAAQFDAENRPDGKSHKMLWQMEIFYSEYADGLADEALWKKSLEHMAFQERSGTESFVVAFFDVAPAQRIVTFGTSSPSSNSVPQMEPTFLPAH